MHIGIVNSDKYPDDISGYLDLPLTDGSRNILANITNKDILNKFIESNKFSNNVCIIRVKGWVLMPSGSAGGIWSPPTRLHMV